MNPLASATPAVSVIPESVVNAAAWHQLQALKAHPLYSGPERIVHTSIDGLSIDLQTSTHNVRLKLTALPPAEQQQILALHKAAISIRGKLGGLTCLAYGGRSSMSRYAEVTPVLEPRKAEIVELFGHMHSVAEVHAVVTQQWGYAISLSTLRAFKARHQEAIRTRQQQVRYDPSRIRLSHKPLRLQELQWAYLLRKAAYCQTPSIANEKQLLNILEQIRQEMASKRRPKHGPTETQRPGLPQPLGTQQLLGVAILDLVVARVSARAGHNPQYLMHRLQTSLYAKFTGAVPATQAEIDETPIYPSQCVYDWEKIKAEAPAREAAEKKLKQWPAENEMSELVVVDMPLPGPPPAPGQAPPPAPTKGALLRAQLLAKIDQLREEVNRNADQIGKTNECPPA